MKAKDLLRTKNGLVYIFFNKEIDCIGFDKDQTPYGMIIRKGSHLGIKVERTQEFTMLKYVYKLKNKNRFVETGTDKGEMIKFVKDDF